MQIKKFKKKNDSKKILITLLILGIVIGGISLYRSYALYEEEKEYNVLKGQIPDFGYDVKFAVTVDNKKQSSIPGRQDSSGNYYDVKVSCENGSTQGEWDYNAWNVKLDNISDGSKCTLAFTGGMSKEDYQKYIDAGIAYRRNTYRGKELKLNDAFWTSIKNGTFDDIYVGDYIVSNQTYDASTGYGSEKIKWLIADIDNYLYSGAGGHELKQHHLTIIPAAPLTKDQMNEMNTTEGGYMGSKMYKDILPKILTDYINTDFRDYVIEYSTVLTNKVEINAINRFGGVNDKGASSSNEWVNDRKLDLMSEANVYGITTWSSSGFDTGIDNRQYAIFQLKPEFINSYKNIRFNYWLKDVVSSLTFADPGLNSHSSYTNASSSIGVRPRFLIG